MVAGSGTAKHKIQMSASSEHEFEGWASVELSGEIFGSHHVRSLKNPDCCDH